jgi:hypothetical protein
MEYANCFKIVPTEFNNQGDLLTIRTQFLKEGSEFKEWIDNRNINKAVGALCVGGGWSSIEVNDELIIGYAMKDGWKFELIDDLVHTMSDEKCDRLIGDFGIRNAYRSFENNGFGDNFPNLGTEDGMKQLLFHILYDIIVISDEIEEIETEEFELLFQENDDDQEEEDEAIVPITDEELDRIGGVVAMCA